MTPAELQRLLLTHLPAIEGVESARAWPGRTFGLVVRLGGAGAVFWMITGASGTAPPRKDAERLPPQPTPALAGPRVATAQVEQALLTALAAGDTDDQVIRADRYSTRPAPPAVRYGFTADCADGWRLFVACVGTAGRGEDLTAERHFHPAQEV
ncbi:hypothetical protein ACWCYY_31475 [Kitasatospora sp. NPDC001664]